jgi:hypothetical protein
MLGTKVELKGILTSLTERKVFVLFACLIVMFAGGLAAYLLAPRFIYVQILRGEGILGYQIDKQLINKLKHPAPNDTSWVVTKLANDKFWLDYHIFDSVLSLPARHPNLKMKTILYWDKHTQLSQLGLNIHDLSGRSLIDMIVLRGTKIDLTQKPDYLNRKWFDNYFENFLEHEYWKLIFSKKLNEWEEDPLAIVTGLRVLGHRKKLFPSSSGRFSFWEEKSMGIVGLENKNKDTKTFIFMQKIGKLIFPILMEINNRDKSAMELAKQILRQWRFEPRSQEIGEFLYKQFLRLDKEQKFSSEGALLLASSWTHNEYNPKYPRIFLLFSRKTSTEQVLLGLNNYLMDRYGKRAPKRRPGQRLNSPAYKRLSQLPSSVWKKLSNF